MWLGTGLRGLGRARIIMRSGDGCNGWFPGLWYVLVVLSPVNRGGEGED